MILGLDTCLTLLDISKFFLKLVLRGDAHATRLSNKRLCLEFVFYGVRHVPHLHWYIWIFFLNLVLRGEAHASHWSNKIQCFKFVILGWGTSLTLLDKSKFFLKLVFGGEAHASPLLNNILCFEFMIFGMRHMPHPSWHIWVFPYTCAWKWGICLTFMKQNSMFWIFVFGVRHMPHPYWHIWIIP